MPLSNLAVLNRFLSEDVVQSHFKDKRLHPVHSPRATIYPGKIAQLPAEILTIVLGFCVHSGNHNSVTARVPWIFELSHVCHLWRSLIQSTRAFWSTIVVDPSAGGFSIPALKQHIRHASKCLHLFVAMRESLGRTDVRVEKEALELLVSTSERWVAAYLERTHHREVLNLVHNKLPLEELHCARLVAQRDFIQPFQVAPRLKQLSSTSLIFRHDLQVPWGQLIVLRVGIFSPAILHAPGLLCLQELYISLLAPQEPVTIPSLKLLSVAHTLSLGGLVVPSLQRLIVAELPDSEPQPDDNLSQLEAFTARTPSISSLSITSTFRSPAALARIFRSLPSLTAATFHIQGFDDALLVVLRDHTIASQITELGFQLHGADLDEGMLRQLQEMLIVRAQHTSLASLSWFGSRLPESTAALLGHFVDLKYVV
ncbi:hypothetical protein FB45DRAFT_1112900 [Roridomyces roridus]|uniref:F-box domain-containing protein n=1 Tax=Roridomyces roridus TaxID=1738132 RepID=A0AAD7B895_9AGAR|nr:hypothetical protein FB45DRAFT_1112900 [Roridomyces roridus]